MKHPCEIIFEASRQPLPSGGTQGVCRITGKASFGMPFQKWVKDTFTNHDVLRPGTIVSHEALFCFEEKSELIQAKTGRDKVQKFRTYSHIVDAKGEWHCLTKADKRKIIDLLLDGPQLVCLTDSGQKHVLFKNRPPMWQLDDSHIEPDAAMFRYLHDNMMALLAMGFSQAEVTSGRYSNQRILVAGIEAWKPVETKIAGRRGEPIFDLAAWLMYSI